MPEAAHAHRRFTSHAIRAAAIAFGLLGAAGATAQAETPERVRVVNTTAIVRWYPNVPSDVLTTVEPGTTLEVLGQEGKWYWIVTPRDAQGSRRGGWVAMDDVETAVVEAADSRPAPALQAQAPPASAPPVEQAAARPREPVRTTAAAPAAVPAPRSYTFDEVLFDRDRSAIRPDAVAVLNAAVAALSSDPALQLSVEGHTCSLGTSAYNLALGNRRALAVRDYLVGRGVTADRIHTVSFGEEHPTHDNAQEETRRLNRRVAIVPTVPAARPATTSK